MAVLTESSGAARAKVSAADASRHRRGDKSESSKNYRRAAWLLIILGTAFHITYSTHLELVGDEAYYWLWSRHPDICYLDKGPMIAWVIRAGTALFGQTVFGVRFFAVLLASGTGVGMFLLAEQLFSARAAFWAVAMAMVIPLYAVGASLMTIDTIYVFFWTWAAFAFWKAKDTSSLPLWIVTGALVGLGILSKYTATLELVSFAAFLLWHAPSRFHLTRRTFWIMIGVALLFFTPAIVWNWQHHWPTSDWLLHRGQFDSGAGLHPSFPLRFIGEQAGVVSPLLFVGLILVLLRFLRLPDPAPGSRYALLLFLPLFGFYLLVSCHYLGPPNWTAAAYIGGLIFLAGLWPSFAQAHRWNRWPALAGLIFAAVETGLLLETRWLHLPPRSDPLDRARGSRDLAAKVVQWQHRTGASFVIADNYMTAALLSFYLPGQPETFVPLTRRPLNQMEIWPSYVQVHATGKALIICKRADLAGSIKATFTDLHSVGDAQVIDGERKIATYHLFVGRRRG